MCVCVCVCVRARARASVSTNNKKQKIVTFFAFWSVIIACACLQQGRD